MYFICNIKISSSVLEGQKVGEPSTKPMIHQSLGCSISTPLYRAIFHPFFLRCDNNLMIINIQGYLQCSLYILKCCSQ